MGNTHAFVHRIPAILTAFFAGCALSLLALSGSVCDFLEIQAKDGYALTIEDGTLPPSDTNIFLGVICMNPFYQGLLEGDVMFIVSRVSLFAALAMGSFTCVLACALATFLTPTEANWKLLSVFAAMVTVLQLPIYMLFETNPCTLFPTGQDCVLARGGICLILSSIFWVVLAVATQILDPPRWADDLNAWRRKTSSGTAWAEHEENRRPFAYIQHDHEVDGDSQSPLLLAASNAGLLRRIQQYMQPWSCTDELPLNHTGSLSEGEETANHQSTGMCHDDPICVTELALVISPPPTVDIRILKNTARQKQCNDEPPIQLINESRLVAFETMTSPSIDGCSFDYSQLSDNENLQLVVWSGSFASEPSEQHVVEDIYADLENPDAETRLAVAQTQDMHQHALLLKQSPITTTTNKKIPSALASPREGHSIAESQIFINEVATSMSQQTKMLNTHSERETGTSTIQLPPSTVATTPSKIIRSLTEKLKRSSFARSGANNYALMNDDDSVVSAPSLPTDVFIRGYDESEHLQVPGSPTTHGDYPSLDPLSFATRTRSRSLGDESDFNYPDPQITYTASIEESSSEEDEPYPAISQSSSHEFDDVGAPIGAANGDADSSSSSESSNGGEHWRLAVAKVKMTSKRHSSGLRPETSQTHVYSPVRSVVTSNSLIDTIINEETDDDLRENESASPYNFVRCVSAPTASNFTCSSDQGRHRRVHLESTFGSNVRQQPEYFSHLESLRQDDILRTPVAYSHSQNIHSACKGGMKKCDLDKSCRSRLRVDPPGVDCLDSGLLYSSPSQWKKDEEVDGVIGRDDSFMSHPGDEVGNIGPGPSGPLSQLDEAASKISATSCDAWRDKLEGKNYSFGSRSVGSASPASTAPETPSPKRCTPETSYHDNSILSIDSERSWKDEKEIRGGIHATPVPDSPCVNEEASRARDMVRQSKIRRLQLGKDKGDRSIEQAYNNAIWHDTNESSMASIVDKLDLQLIEVLRPLGVEYGPDESSL